MNKYEKTLEWLFSQLPMYQRMGKAAYKANLDTTVKLDEYFGHPHKKFKTIHVAGTNGKGSVSHMLAAILSKAGYKTGLYTSPHLLDFRERIRIDGKMIEKREVVAWVEEHQKIFEEMQPSFFEMTVALAFDYFAKEEVELAVIEVGMGGRLDSTNIINPEVSVITNIGKDHTDFLGNTLLEIAGEKAGIIKYGIPVVMGERRPELAAIFKNQAHEMTATLFDANQFFQVPCSVLTPDGRHFFHVKRGKRTVFPELCSDLSGIVQRRNLPVVLETIEVLRLNQWTIPEIAVYEGLSKTKELTGLNGRWEIIERKPLLVYDTAHNEDGIRNILYQLEETRHAKLLVVIGAVNDKAIDKVLQMLPADGYYYFTQASIPRALDAKVLAAKAGFYGLKGSIVEDVKEAITTARETASADDLILVTGSTFVVAEAY
ncbi:MAG: folylpolyglutamate synthase/dihydrofolate synthase family protein [Bacteroidota bacterium]|nr:folylpolyglutamate synthase/dihydrofolate synthase family protein [Bacteroidota bacterium]